MQVYILFLLFPFIFSQQQTDWNYFSGGNDWHQIWPTCSSVKGQQSPIDIHYENVRNVTQAILHIESMAKNIVARVENNGYFLKADFPWMNIKVNDNTGKVRSAQCFTMSIHAPSEHVIEGNRFNMEIQFTCEDIVENGKYLNLALLCESERFQENELIDKFAAAAVNLKSKGTKQKVSLNFEESFTKTLKSNNIQDYYTYTGSFTVKASQYKFYISPLHAIIQLFELFLQGLQKSQTKRFPNSKPYGLAIKSLLEVVETIETFNYCINLQRLYQESFKKIQCLWIFQNKCQIILINLSNRNGFEKEDTKSEKYYKNKIDRNLQILVKQRTSAEYNIKAIKKLKYLEKCVNVLKHQLNEDILNGDGTNQEVLSKKVKQAQIDFQQFQANCMEYKENLQIADCNPEIIEQDPKDSNSQVEKEEQKEEALTQSQELSDTKSISDEEVMVTHDGQVVPMKIPDDLQFIQTSKRKLRRKSKLIQ